MDNNLRINMGPDPPRLTAENQGTLPTHKRGTCRVIASQLVFRTKYGTRCKSGELSRFNHAQTT